MPHRAHQVDPFAETNSVCPECLTVIPARYRLHDDGVYLEKECPTHGQFEAIVWHGSEQSYRDWLADAGDRDDRGPKTRQQVVKHGCPLDCGVCREHKSEPCSSALMVTDRCNLECRFCFTRSCASQTRPDPTLQELEQRLRFYLDACGEPFPLELCGGEPTVRADLCDIASMAHDMGFSHIQLNSNGIMLGKDASLAKQLKQAGVTCVYLGYDGRCDEPYAQIAGSDLLSLKEKAVEHCAEAGLAVVLVPTLVPGVNDDAIGKVIRYAIDHMPAVKGVNIQPAGHLGLYHDQPDNSQRCTIPDLLRIIEQQTSSEMQADDFMPPAVEHPLCSLQALYVKDVRGNLKALSKRAARGSTEGAAARNRTIAARQWANGAFSTLTIGAMVIQDAWTYDVERARLCPMFVIGDNTLYPLCTKYLTAIDGRRLYPGIA